MGRHPPWVTETSMTTSDIMLFSTADYGTPQIGNVS